MGSLCFLPRLAQSPNVASVDHAVCCPCGPSRTARHDAVNKCWAFTLKSSGFSVEMEVFTDPASNARSADTWVANWRHGCPAAHDWCVCHPAQVAALGSSVVNPERTLLAAEERKNGAAFENCRSRGINFCPLACDTFGGFGPIATQAIHWAVTSGKVFRGFHGRSDPSTSERSVAQRLRVVAMRGVARQLLRRVSVVGLDCERPRPVHFWFTFVCSLPTLSWLGAFFTVAYCRSRDVSSWPVSLLPLCIVTPSFLQTKPPLWCVSFLSCWLSFPFGFVNWDET